MQTKQTRYSALVMARSMAETAIDQKYDEDGIADMRDNVRDTLVDMGFHCGILEQECFDLFDALVGGESICPSCHGEGNHGTDDDYRLLVCHNCGGTGR